MCALADGDNDDVNDNTVDVSELIDSNKFTLQT